MFPKEILPAFIATLRAVVKANFSTEVVRTLATFVTSFSQKSTISAMRVLIPAKPGRPASVKSINSPVKRTFTVGEDIDLPRRPRKASNAKEGSNYEVVVLEMLVEVLLSPERRYINKFATTITSKVLYLTINLTDSGPYYSCPVPTQITSFTESRSWPAYSLHKAQSTSLNSRPASTASLSCVVISPPGGKSHQSGQHY
jgi:hypothetical protein